MKPSISQVFSKQYLLLALLLISLLYNSPLNAQGYIDCATSLFGRLARGEVVDGNTYTATISTGESPVINGQPSPPSGNGSIYVSVFDDNCQQTFGTYWYGENPLPYGDAMEPLDVTVDANGNIFVLALTGYATFPTTDGTAISGHQRSLVLAKFSPSTGLVYSTVVASDPVEGIYGVDHLHQIKVAPNGDVVVGTALPGPFFGVQSFNWTATDGSMVTNDNYFLARYDGSGSLLYSTIQNAARTLFGSSKMDIAVDANYTYVVFVTSEDGLPTTDGSTLSGEHDLYYAKYDNMGNRVFATYIGGSENEYGLSTRIFSPVVQVDNGMVYIAGNTDNGAEIFTDGSSSTDDRTRMLIKYDAADNLVYILPRAVGRMKFVDGNIYSITDVEDDPTTIVVNGEPAVDTETDLYFTKINGADGSIEYGTFFGGGELAGGVGGTRRSSAVNAAGEVYFVTPTVRDPITTDGTSGSGTLVGKLNSDGTLCYASMINNVGNGDGPGFLDRDKESMHLDGNTITFFLSKGGRQVSTDGTYYSGSESPPSSMVKYSLCPTPPVLVADNVEPAVQNVCQNSSLEQLQAPAFKYDGTEHPQLFVDGVPQDQQDINLHYQWQFSSDNAVWIDVAGPIGQLRNYSPPPTTQDIYYRRLTTESECCGNGAILSTSSVAFIDVDENIASEADAGGRFYVCPGMSVTIGNPVNNSVIGNAPPYTYAWSNGDNTATPTVTVLENSVFTLTITDANNCEQVDQAIVTTFTADAGADKAVCAGNATTLGASLLPGVPVVIFGAPVTNEYCIAYSWSPTAGLDNANIPNPTASSSGTYSLTVTLYQPDGTSCQTTDEVTVTEISGPSNSDFAGPDLVVCAGQTAVLGTAEETVTNNIEMGTALSVVTQSSSAGATATTTNLTDGDFTTGGLTGDLGELTIDLGAEELISRIELAALDGATSNNCFFIDISTDGTNYSGVAFTGFSGFPSSQLTEFSFDLQPVRYIRFTSSFSFCKISISEIRASAQYQYIWTPGTFISDTDIPQPTFIPGSNVPTPNPITYTVTANFGNCNFYDQVDVYVIEARADIDGCGPRSIGLPDRTPNIDETYSWQLLSSDAGTTSNFIGVTDQPIANVSGNDVGSTTYELTTTFELDGVIYTCTDEVVVPPCECLITIASDIDGGCIDFDANGGLFTLTATAATIGSASASDPDDFIYTWTPSTGLNTDTGREVMVVDNVDRTYSVSATSNVGPEFNCTRTIQVNNPANSSPTFSPNSPVVTCVGNPVNIGDPANNPGLSYAWEPSAFLDDPAISFPEATVDRATDFTVTVTDIVTGCTVEALVTVEVGGQASAGVDSYLCDNGTVTLGTPALPGYTYLWSPAGADWRDGTNSSDPSQVNEAMPNVFVATVGGTANSQTFTLTTTSPEGCVSEDEVIVFVSPLPPVVTLTDVTFCPSETPLILGFTSSDGTGTNQVPSGYSYQWLPGGLLVDAEAQNPMLIAPLPSDEVTFTLQIRSGGGCNQITTQTISPNIVGPITLNNPEICTNEPITIGSADNTTGMYSWVADGGNPAGGSLNDLTSGNPEFTSTSPGNFTYVVTRTEGMCSSSNTVVITVQEIEVPVVASINLCMGETNVVIGPTIVDGSLSYSWFPTDDLSDPGIPQPTFTGSTSRNYTLTVSNANGCLTDVTMAVNVSPEVTPLVVINDLDVCILLDPIVQLDATVTPAGSYAYSWSSSDFLNVSNIEDPTFLIPGNGTYQRTLTVTDQTNGCSGQATVTVTASEAACSDFDLALTKVVATSQNTPVYVGDDIVFTVTIFNQGMIDATNIDITDYIPTNTTYAISGQTPTGTLMTTMSNTVGFTNNGGGTFTIDELAATDNVSFDLVLTIGVGAMGTLTNNAEIVAADGGIDQDSPLSNVTGTIDYTDEVDTDDDVADESNGGVDNNMDEDDLDPAQFFVCAAPTVTLTDPADECVGGSNMSFTATPAPGAGTTGIFSTTATAGLTDNGDGTATLNISDAGVGTYNVTYTYTEADGCDAINEVVSVEIFAAPTINAVVACDASLTTYSISVTTTNADQLTSDVGMVTGAAPNFMVTGIAIGADANLTATNTTATCTLMQMVTSPVCSCPAMDPTVTGDEVCAGETASLSASGNADCDELRWYAASTGGSPLFTGSPFVTPALITATTYHVACYNTGNDCESNRVPVVAMVNALPVVTVANPAAICSTQAVDLTQGASILPTDLGGTWSSSGNGMFTTGADFATATTYVPGSMDAAAEQVTLTLTSNDPAGPCSAIQASVTFIILKVDCGTFPWGGE